MPFIVRGPGIAAGSWCHQPVIASDWFPTLCRWADIEPPHEHPVDGEDLSGCLFATATPPPSRARGLLFHFPHYQGDSPQSAIREGDFKLVYFHESKTRNLYDLAHDPAEVENLAPSRPELADRLQSLLLDRLKEAHAAMPQPNASFDPSAPPAPRKGGRAAKPKPQPTP